MATLKIDKKFIDEAVQKAVEDIKQNFVPLSVIEDIKAEIQDFEEDVFHRPSTNYEAYACVRHCLDIIDKHLSGNEGDRLYIKIYADMEPGDIAEKVYCICNEEKLPEVVDILSEIVRDNCGEVNK